MRNFATEFHLKWIQWLHLGRDTRGAFVVR